MVDDYLEVPDAEALRLEAGALTVALWVKFTGPKTRRYDLVEKMGSVSGPTTASGFIFHTLSTESGSSKIGRLRFCFGHVGIGGRRCHDAQTDIVDGQFHHVVAVKSGMNVMIYVDGRDDNAIFDHSVGHPLDPPVSLLFGKRRNDTAFLQGTMDEIMIFDRALSAVEIRSIFDARSDGMCGQGVGGSVTGMLPNRITCRNMTTGQAVTAKMGSTTWDCNQLGLVVRPGDRIRLTVTGQAEDP